MRLIDIEEIEEKINALQEYDIVGDYDLTIVQCEGGDYYRVEDVKDIINSLKSELDELWK